MTLIYKCPECDKVIDQLEVDRVDEETLGLNVLTEEERKDIIETKQDNTYINITCDECAQITGLEQRVDNFQIH